MIGKHYYYYYSSFVVCRVFCSALFCVLLYTISLALLMSKLVDIGVGNKF